MRDPYNILRHELIGLYAEVADSTHEGYKFSGKIVDETKNTLVIETAGSADNTKTVPKNCVFLDLTLDDGSVIRVDGRLLVGRPEERIKKKHKIKFT